MSALDWVFILAPLGVVFAAGYFTRRYMRSVADFLSCGRLANRYLLAVSKGEMAAGAVVFVATFERVSQAGFNLSWWQWLQIPVTFIVAISGFVIYRYRETRAMTLAQFFEIRYSKAFRLFTGGLGFVAGLINFGIIPVVGARFITVFLGLPLSVPLFGHAVPTHILLMAVLLSITVFITLSGGIVTIMVTDCIEGIISQLIYLAIIVGLLMMFDWSVISETLSSTKENHSLLNPFNASGIEDFNLWFILMSIFITTYGTMAWQNASAYNSAAISAHESRMATVLGHWREQGKVAVVTLLTLCAITFLNHPDFAHQSAAAHSLIDHISQPQIQKQMTVPVALSELLPLGLKGLFCAVLLMGIFGGDSTHLHSWSSMFVQDILVPVQKKPFSPRRHIFILRLAVIGVAVFAFVFGALFQQTEYISMWWQVTMGLYVGGAGAAIIGGLYWKKGTTAGAWASMITGSSLCAGGILLRQIWGKDFPLNGIQVAFFGSLIAISVYVIVSLLTNRRDFDMDRMLHRGEHSAEGIAKPSRSTARRSWFSKLIGADTHFTTGDKWIAGGLCFWSLGWFLIVLTGSVWNLVSPWPDSVWSKYWHIAGIGIPVTITFITSIWFTLGGIRDIRILFRRLRTEKVDIRDDGTVVRDHVRSQEKEG